MRVLIADDDRVFSQMMVALCKQKGWRAMAAYDTMQVLMFAAREPQPDVLILDLAMPGGTGVMALERLRASVKTVDLPVIVVTGTLQDASRKRLEALGVKAIFTKPPDLVALAAMIEEVGAER
jgi:CheY-like chemotaxis protein